MRDVSKMERENRTAEPAGIEATRDFEPRL